MLSKRGEKIYDRRNLQWKNINHTFLALLLAQVGGATHLGAETTKNTPNSAAANRLWGRRRGKDKHYFTTALIFLTKEVEMRYERTRLYSSEELQTSYSCKSPVPNPQAALLFPGLVWKRSTAALLSASWISHCFHIQQLGWQCCGLESPPPRS